MPILSSTLPKLEDVTKNNNSDFLPKNSPSSQAAELENAFQRKDTAGTATIVVNRDGGPFTAADQGAIKQLITNVQQDPDVTEIHDQGVSADGQAQQFLIGISDKAFGEEALTVIKDIRQKMSDTALPAGVRAYLTGDVAVGVDQANEQSNGRTSTELYTVIFILVLLLFVFRAILAPIVTLIPAGLALMIGSAIIAESTKIGVQVGFITQIMLIVLILGAGTDYGLFLVFRVREELRKGLAPKDAVIKAMSKVGESITFSASTVVAAVLSLLLASFGIYRGLGPALGIGLVVMLLISLTFLPALLAVLGRAVFWPSKTRKQPLKIGVWGKVADKVIERPKTMLLIGAVVFGALAAGLIGYSSSGFGNQTAPKDSESARGQEIISQHFPQANNQPQLLIFRFDKPVWGDLTSVAKTETLLTQSSTFKAISGPFNINGLTVTPGQLQQLHATDPQNPLLQTESQFISADGQTVQFYGLLNAGTTNTVAAMKAVPEVRAELQRIGDQVGANQAALYSSDAIGYDVNKVSSDDLKKIIPVVLLIIAILLAVLLRSFVAPVYLILTVGLSYLASLGFAMIVFVHFGSAEGLFFILPFLMFIFVMALGEDYNILVMSRIREEVHNEKDLKAAVTKAIGITGTTVTSAGIILAGTFGVLGLVGGGDTQQIGYGVAFGILLDTFFVRTLLVPSIVVLLDKWNWWPSHLSRR